MDEKEWGHRTPELEEDERPHGADSSEIGDRHESIEVDKDRDEDGQVDPWEKEPTECTEPEPWDSEEAHEKEKSISSTAVTHAGSNRNWVTVIALLVGLIACTLAVVSVWKSQHMPTDRPDIEKHTPAVSESLATPSATDQLPEESENNLSQQEQEPSGGQLISAPPLEDVDFEVPSYSEGLSTWEVSFEIVDTAMTERYRDVGKFDTMEEFEPAYNDYIDELKEQFTELKDFDTFEPFDSDEKYRALQASSEDEHTRLLLYCEPTGSQDVTVSHYLEDEDAMSFPSAIIHTYVGIDVPAEKLEAMLKVVKMQALKGGTQAVMFVDGENSARVQVAVQNWDTENQAIVVSATRVLKGPVESVG